MKLMSLIKSLLLVLLLALSGTTGKAAAVGTEFLYQGALVVNGSRANGAFEMTFTLFRQGETSPMSTVSNNNVAVSLGLFTVKLDFGAGVFDGTAHELGIAVRERGSSGPFVVLAPRQPLTATPNSLHAETVRSVPDSALSSNIPLLNGSPMFSTPVGATTLRLANAAGGGVLNFGNNPDNLCAIAVDPQGPAGLLLRDPKGIRILSPDPVRFPPVLRFGPTDDCSIGIDPVLSGLILRDPIGFRLLGRNNQGHRLIFGPTMDCTIEVQPPAPNSIAGLLLRDPKGIRILNPDPAGANTVLFGPTEDCRISAAAGPEGGMGFSDPNGFTFGNRVMVNGPVFAQAFVQTSSRRFKNEVKPIEQPLEKIAKLQGVRFTWNKEQGGRQDIGFIAEEVGKIIPEVVSWEEDGQNARGVNYDHLVAVAIEGIKAQQTKIETLEREKTELKESVASLQEQLDRLARKLETVAAR